MVRKIKTQNTKKKRERENEAEAIFVDIIVDIF